MKKRANQPPSTHTAKSDTLQLPFFNKIGYLDILFFTKHLSMMIKSGIPIAEATDIIKQQTKNVALQNLLTHITADLINGQSLESTLAKHPKVFDPFYLNLIRIGETSGNLEKNLDYLAVQLKKNYEFKKKVKGALLYPEIVLSITVIAGGAISFFVLPQLVDLFSQLDVKLPLSTKILLFMATTMKDYGIIIFAALAGVIASIRLLIHMPQFRGYWHTFLLSLPVVGLFQQNAELGFFCRNFGIMLKSGLPITTALFAQESATTNEVYKKYVNHIAEAVEKGHTISETLAESNYRFIPPIFIKMVNVGEKTGTLDESLVYLGDFFEEEIDEYSQNFSSILEPFILIFVGIAVAFVAFAIISPIYQLTSGIHR